MLELFRQIKIKEKRTQNKVTHNLHRKFTNLPLKWQNTVFGDSKIELNKSAARIFVWTGMVSIGAFCWKCSTEFFGQQMEI